MSLFQLNLHVSLCLHVRCYADRLSITTDSVCSAQFWTNLFTIRAFNQRLRCVKKLFAVGVAVFDWKTSGNHETGADGKHTFMKKETKNSCTSWLPGWRQTGKAASSRWSSAASSALNTQRMQDTPTGNKCVINIMKQKTHWQPKRKRLISLVGAEGKSSNNRVWRIKSVHDVWLCWKWYYIILYQ